MKDSGGFPLKEFLKSAPGNFILKNPEAIDPYAENYIPKTIMYREDQLREIAIHLRPIFAGGIPRNAVIRGLNGTGKTLTIKYAIKNLREVADEEGLNIGISYASAQDLPQYRTRNYRPSPAKYILALMRSIGMNTQHLESGIGWMHLMEMFRDYINEQDFHHVVIVCDDIDRVGHYEFLTNFARIHEVWGLKPQIKVTAFFITSRYDFIKEVPKRALDSIVRTIYFPPYKTHEIINILKARLEDALVNPEIIPEEILTTIAAETYRRNSDLRFSLKILQKLVYDYIMIREKITKDDLNSAIMEIEHNKIKEIVQNLNFDAQAILLALLHFKVKKGINGVLVLPEVPVETLYTLYSKLIEDTGLYKKLSRKRISDILQTLSSEGLINYRVVGKGRGRGVESLVRFSDDFTMIGVLKALISRDSSISYFYQETLMNIKEDLEEIFKININI